LDEASLASLTRLDLPLTVITLAAVSFSEATIQSSFVV